MNDEYGAYVRSLNAEFERVMQNDHVARYHYKQATKRQGLSEIAGLKAAIVALSNANRNLVREMVGL